MKFWFYKSKYFKYGSFIINTNEWYLPLKFQFNIYVNRVDITFGFLCFEVSIYIPRKYVNFETVVSKFQDKYYDRLFEASDEIGEFICKKLDVKYNHISPHLDFDTASKNKLNGTLYIDFSINLKEKMNKELREELKKHLDQPGINSFCLSELKKALTKIHEAESNLLFLCSHQYIDAEKIEAAFRVAQKLKRAVFEVEQKWIMEYLREKK